MNFYKRFHKREKKPSDPACYSAADRPFFTFAKKSSHEVMKILKSSASSGLSIAQSHTRLLKYGRNEIVREKRRSWVVLLLKNFKDPLSALLVALALISYLTHDMKATIMIGIMVVLSVFLRFYQEIKADFAAQKLKAMVRTVAHVVRKNKIKKIPFERLVPGDIIHLSAGDMIPADVRLLETNGLYINEATLTGEALPAEKHSQPIATEAKTPLELNNICFLGTNVASGSAKAIVILTGSRTYLGCLAESLVKPEPPTTFDLGVKKFTWLIMGLILVMSPAVFLINGFAHHQWLEAFLFAMAVAVGLAPEMLPMIVAVNLSKGALVMSKKKVIVKHLDSIQNFGAMDILCMDKTGTLTEGKVVLEKYLNIKGEEEPAVLEYAFLNSFFQTGLENLLDAAVLKHKDVGVKLKIKSDWKKIDEIPFDFIRRRMSVVMENKEGDHLLICKGAVEEIISLSSHVDINHHTEAFHADTYEKHLGIEDKMNDGGFRVVGVAYKKIPNTKTRYSIADETGMTLVGFLAFLDPPKETAKVSLNELRDSGITVKLLTGDNELVTRKICLDVGLEATDIVLGSEIEEMSEEEIKKIAIKINIFAKLTPMQKEQIVSALRSANHTVGFMGDGINDAPALRGADVGISVDTAVDIAKESSDIILLEKDLSVLYEGVREGRRIFGNITKYIQMSASSNFGNMFSVVGGSIFLPFLPMLPIQILVNNLLYDLSQTTIPTDKVDEEYLKKPRQWRIDHIRRFIMFIGPVSSLFDYATFFVMLFVFNTWLHPSLFQTGWFVESLLSQTLIIHVIRTNKIPFIQSRASWPLIVSTVGISAIGVALPYSPFASSLGFSPLPLWYWPILIAMLFIYFFLTQMVKRWFAKKYRIE
ncbi:MAG: magnesium-translocating P-type ATPase [Candidatus Magasanikbacteria bacterium]|nr:magnesium-translocating P-type ATPase [Candidatus Magasanikbacteria bacterium]